MKNHILSNIIIAGAALAAVCGCSGFLSDQVPQGALTDEQMNDPAFIDGMVASAYAVFTTAEDVSTSFSLWNFDIRSDDAYKGGASPSDEEILQQLEIGKGFGTDAWYINNIWKRFYEVISRVNEAIVAVERMDESDPLKNERLAELRFLRAYAHFQLKRLFKQIPFVLRTDYALSDYYEISNTEYTNDEGWGKIANEVEEALRELPETQAEKGRPTKAAAAAFLAKIYLYKAYRQDTFLSNEVTEINQEDLQKVIQYTEMVINSGKYRLEDDLHNNFRPEEQYKNGPESIWAIQYSREGGSTYGNLNWSNGLIVPAIAGVTDGGRDFYKPSQNLVNAFITNDKGLPNIDAPHDLDYTADNTDPRLYLTVGMPGLPYMFNEQFMMDRSTNWSRSGGIYGYYVSLKQNVDPALTGEYLFHGPCWASPMNRIVFRYADVLLMRAEAFAQLGQGDEAVKIINSIRERAAKSTRAIAGYPVKYGVKIYCKPYSGQFSKEETMKIVKTERRLELAMEAERFFDLVRWGDANEVLNAYFASEKTGRSVYGDAVFTANKNEYLPIPFGQMAASNGYYTQNSTQW